MADVVCHSIGSLMCFVVDCGQNARNLLESVHRKEQLATRINTIQYKLNDKIPLQAISVYFERNIVFSYMDVFVADVQRGPHDG